MTHAHLSDKDYEYVFQRVPQLNVDVAVFDAEGKILLGLRSNEPNKGKWDMPGGRVIKGERLADAAKRVIEKETGLVIEVPEKGAILGVMEFPAEQRGDIIVHTNSIVIRARIVGGTLRPGPHNSDVQLFQTLPEDMIPEHLAFILENGLLV
jgi:colanic acid biosynthesis protein WcaH